MAVHYYTDDSLPEVLRSKEKVIIKFYADWCGSCKLLAPKFRRLSEDSRFSDIHFAEVNAEESDGARAMAGVDNLPFIALFCRGELIESSASGKEEVVLSMLEKLASL
jgi:thioredoxin 1